MIGTLTIPRVNGLDEEDWKQLQDLVAIFNRHIAKNREKDKYYNGHISLDDVNLGIALPDGLRKLEIGCEWGAKCVDVLASRSMFDGFVGIDGANNETLERICKANRLVAEYMKACRDELKYGCTFVTLASAPQDSCTIRFHSPMTAAAKWDGLAGRIGCGFVILDSEEDEITQSWDPTLIHMHTEIALIEIRRKGSEWYAAYHRHKMGRPLMETMVWNPTSHKPFGRSRLKEPVRRLIQGYVRTIANATIGLEFSTTPQKYLLGVTDEQFDKVVNQKFRQYIGSIFTSTENPNTGNNPNFGQLSQGTIEPHVQMIKILATQFSAATGLTVTDTGVVNDANPTSSDAILAQSQTLVSMAEQLNAANGDALNTIAQMALAIVGNLRMEELSEEDQSMIAHFKNPAMPSVAVTADAAIKIASARKEFAGTDTFLEMIGFSQADIRRIRAQETKARGLLIAGELSEGANGNITENMEQVYGNTSSDQ